ncbi:MAG: hypothetical protein K2X50_06385 [Gammaproteobacteria bacterium]|nr:hypothetical protein [Gammaproteobacteria bacterium]
MNKDNPSREPVRGPWWVRVANFFSNLFKTEDELKREQEVKEINAIGQDFLLMQEFVKGINNPDYRNELNKRLASGSVEIRSSLANYLVQVKDLLKENKIPNNAEDILNGLREVIDEVDKMQKGAAWNLGDKDVPGTWDRWREGMINGINQAMDSIRALKQERSAERLNADQALESPSVNRYVEKEKLYAFIEKGLPENDNYRELLKTQLASGRNDIVLNIPAYLHEEMKNLQNKTVSEGLPGKLEKLIALLGEVKKMEKGSAWKTSEVDANTSSDSWFTAMSNTINLLNGMIDKIQPQNRTVAGPVQQAPVSEEETQEKGTQPQQEVIQGQVTEQSTRPPLPSTGPLPQTPPPPPSASGPQAAPRTSGKEVPGRVSTRPAVPTAPLPRPSGRGPLPTPGQGSQPASTKESPSRVSTKQVGITPLARPSGRPLPTPGQGSQPASTKDNPSRVSTRPAVPTAPLPRPSGRPLPTPAQGSQSSSKENLSRVSARLGVAPTPVRRKTPAVAVDQPKPLRVSQTGNLPRESQGSTEGIKPVSEPPLPLPRKTQGPSPQPSKPKTDKPVAPPRTSQAQPRSGQVENLKRERDQKTSDVSPPLPELPKISSGDSGSTPTNKK